MGMNTDRFSHGDEEMIDVSLYFPRNLRAKGDGYLYSGSHQGFFGKDNGSDRNG